MARFLSQSGFFSRELFEAFLSVLPGIAPRDACLAVGLTDDFVLPLDHRRKLLEPREPRALLATGQLLQLRPGTGTTSMKYTSDS